MANILIVDDDAAVRTSMQVILRRAGHTPVIADNPTKAVEKVRSESPDMALIDMNYTLRTDGEEGLELLQKMHVLAPQMPVILITAWGTIDLAVRGMRAGAFDFITKPWDTRVMLERINTALNMRRPEPVNESTFDRCGIIGETPELTEILEVVKRVAPTNAPVLITGESGTGKELIAEALHRNSKRSGKPFVKVNLGGIHRELFDSEMFGHKRGSFTGAVADRKGRFEEADGGTIFLDEIGDLDAGAQVKLLRVLQEQKFEPLGSNETISVNVRVICATNADLEKLMAEGRFREDLFYRINLVGLHVPALRERRADIPSIARHFAEVFCRDNGLKKPFFDNDAIQKLTQLPWPGNIRQLRNVVDRAVLLGDGHVTADNISGQTEVPPVPTANATLQDLERVRVSEAMQRNNGNVSRAAAELGLSRGALYRRLEKYGLI